MANTVSLQEIVNGPRNYVLKVNIQGDGSGEETATVVADASLLGVDTLCIKRIQSSLEGFQTTLNWGGATQVPIVELPDDVSEFDGRQFGGFKNNKTANYDGDITITTVGLGAADEGTILLECTKHGER